MSLNPSLLPRDAIVRLRASKIREVANAGIGRANVLAFWFGEPDEVAPQLIRDAASFFDISDANDRLVSANTFSKSWLMTGWRLGWLVAPAPFIEQLGKVIGYNTSCSLVFIEHAGNAAITHGDAVIARTQTRFGAARDHLCAALNALPGVHAPPPLGAMYAFFKGDGITDSLAFCKRPVTDFGFGIAPGAGFGNASEGFLR